MHNNISWKKVSKASYDGSTMIARNDDSGAGHYMPKKFVVVHPEERQKVYRSVISHVEIELPDNPTSGFQHIHASQLMEKEFGQLVV